ncbi:protein FAM186A-like [Mastomys coucha]|uniref:protein FAM186A-like n=1 Tax=Mastomys coucha TaxID=35658 RepID=UPI00126245F1|nr:protein FAM186A-like [Mastomys coucha]
MSAKRQSKANDESDSGDESMDLAILRKPKSSHDNSMSLQFEIPAAVQAVISKIEESQSTRAKEDVIFKLSGIMNNVQLIMTRYNIDSASLGQKSSVSEGQKKKRKDFLEKIAMCVKNSEIRERTLYKILSWLEEWNFVLSEVAAINMDEYHHWIAKMELMPAMLKGINNNVDSMIQMTLFLIEEKKRMKKKTLARGTLWKAWKDRAIKRPATAQAMRADQMTFDQMGLNTKVSEIQSMLQELINTAMFSKLENNAIKYISVTLGNLSKALSTVNDELRLVSSRVAKSVQKEDQVEEKESDNSRQVIQELSEENEMLQQRLREAEERCDQLIRIKNYLGRQMTHPAASLKTNIILPLQVPYISRVARDNESDEKTDDSQKKGAKSTAVMWDPSASEADLDAGKEQAEDIAETTQDQKKIKGLPLTDETLDTNPEMEEKKSRQLAILKALEKEKAGKLKGQKGKDGPSAMWERLKKGKSEQLIQGTPGSPESRESTLKLTDKEAKSEVDLLQPEGAPEPQKPETRWKKLIAAKTEETKQSGKLQAKTSKATSLAPEESEQSSLESFQRAILAFLREKMNNVGKAFDPKSIHKEESSLEKAEVEKLNIIKAKIEEYFQKVAETVTIALRTYREGRKVQPKEKPKKQPKGVLGMLRTPPRQAVGGGAKSEVGRVLLSEITDPAIKKLVEMLLEEIDSDLRYKRTKEQQQEVVEVQKEEPREKPKDKTKLLEVWRQALQSLEVRQAQDLRDAEDGERLKWIDSSYQDLRKIISPTSMSLTTRLMKTPKPQISQAQLPGVMEAAVEKLPKLSPSSSTAPSTHVPEQTQIIGPQTLSGPLTSGTPLEIKTAFTARQEQEPGPKLIVPKIPKPTQIPKGPLKSEKPKAMQISQELSGVTTLPFQEVQVTDSIPTSQQALEQESTPSPEQVKEPRITLTPQQTQALGITLTPEQTKTQKISLTHEQAQALGITLTPEQYKEQRINLTPQQAQALGITLNLQQAQALGITLTPEQAKAQRVSLNLQQSQTQGTTLTTQQAEAQRTNLTSEQAKALGLSLTPPHPITFTSEQVQALGITPTPQPITLSPEQTQALGITPTPQPITLSPEQVQALGITPTPQPITLSPEQTQALGITPTPQPITLSPEQTQALGITPTPQPITLSPEQTQALGITPTPQPITLSPEQTQALGITPTPQSRHWISPRPLSRSLSPLSSPGP